MRIFFAAFITVASIASVAVTARADVPSPDEQACREHQPGAACIQDNGQAGRCRYIPRARHGHAAEVLACTPEQPPPSAPAPHH